MCTQNKIKDIFLSYLTCIQDIKENIFIFHKYIYISHTHTHRQIVFKLKIA